jgi:molecular chaperone GrpE
MKHREVNTNGQNDDQEMKSAVNSNVDENMESSVNQPEPDSNEAEINELKSQVEALNDKVLRQAAEFDNFKRRNARERIELIQTAGRDVITELLVVLDDSERAEQQMEKTDDIDQVRLGVQLVFSKLRNILSSRGLKPMESKGKEFNADLHEAVTEMDAGPDMKGKVVDEVQKGYYLNDKIIRFAKVVVGK